MESRREGTEGGERIAGEMVFVCAAFVSILIVLLCVRSGCGSRGVSHQGKSRRSSRRRPRHEVYEDAASTLGVHTPPPHTWATFPICHLARGQEGENPRAPSLDIERLARLHDYEEAKPILDHPPSRVHLHQYEEAIIVRDPQAAQARGDGMTDSAGYTIPNDPLMLLNPGPAPSEYNHLGEEQLKRTLSAPACHCKAYSHVMLAPRSMSCAAKTSANGNAYVREDVTSPEHQYDVTSVVKTESPRVEVIDGIYDKLDKSEV
ncbi:hypothetical protein ACOMHN_006559 [Nucella lapillus]